MSKRYFLAFFLLFALFAADIAEAQRRPSQFRGRRTNFSVNRRYLSIGGHINALNYFGDLAPKSNIASTELSFTRPGFGASLTYRIGPQTALRGSLMWGRLRADDNTADYEDTQEAVYRYVRNLHFRNDIKEASLDLIFDLKPHYRTFISRPQWVPYLFAGVAVFYHNPRAKVPDMDYVNDPNGAIPITESRHGVSAGDWIELRPLGTEGQYIAGKDVDTYSKIQLAVPFGVGMRYRLNRYFDLAFEFGYRQTFTDYLDDVSGDYVRLADFDQGDANPDLARLMSYRSNEPEGAVTGDTRVMSFENIQRWELDGYSVYRGFDGTKDSFRGKDDYDVYLVSRFTLTYILGTTVRNAKFR